MSKKRSVSIIQLIDDRFEEIICAISFSMVAICVFLQFCVRAFFGSAMAWPEELAIYGMAWGVYMGSSMCVREKAHLRILLVVNSLPRKLAISVIGFGDLCWLIFNLFMVVVGFDYIGLLWEQEFISPALSIDQKWPQSIIVIGYLMMSFRIIQHYILWIKNGCPELPA